LVISSSWPSVSGSGEQIGNYSDNNKDIMEEKIISIIKQIILGVSSLLIFLLIFIALKVNHRSEYLQDWQQLTLSGLNRVDRCISCHPDTLIINKHPSTKLLKQHTLDDFGCTICHQGEGRAINKEIAHEDLTPAQFIQSNCVQCHLAFYNTDHYTKDCGQIYYGKQILHQSGCLGCHKIKQTGGAVGPDITALGDKPPSQFDYTHLSGAHTIFNWLWEHFYNPQKISPGSQMFPFLFPEGDMQAVITLLTGLKQAVYSHDYYDLEVLKEFKAKREILDAPRIFGLFCSACHGEQRKDNTYPLLATNGFLSVASHDYLSFIINEGRSNRPMASWASRYSGLYREELYSIQNYIRSWRPAEPDFNACNLVNANTNKGKITFIEKCAFCHGTGTRGIIGPAILTIDFLSAAADSFIFNTVVNGRANTAMPSWRNLSTEQLSNMLSFMRTLSLYNGGIPIAASVDGDSKSGRDKYHYLCSRCHGKKGWGEIGPAILNPDFLHHASERFILNTIIGGRSHSAMFGWEDAVAGYGKQDRMSIYDIIAFMKSQKDSLPDRIYPGINLGKPDAGRLVYLNHCSKCHGKGGEGIKAPALNNQEFLNAASNGFMTATLVLGRENTDMPVWSKTSESNPALTSIDVNNVVSFIRTWQVMTIYLRR
jgi:mono/diheme cytochrome c family protein